MRSMPPTKVLSKSQADIDLHGPNQFFTFSLVFSAQNSGHDQLTAMFQFEPIDGRSCDKANDGTLCPATAQMPLRDTVEIALVPSSSSSMAAPTSRGRSMAPSQSLISSPMR